jgi:parallel beta-helix repeat protein
MLFSWRTWLLAPLDKSGLRNCSTPRPQRRRPRLEELEQRLAPATLTVNNIWDEDDTTDNLLSLDEAIEVVNGDLAYGALSAGEKNQIDLTQPLGKYDTIYFDLGGGEQTIFLEAALPKLTKPVNIDGIPPPDHMDQVVNLDGSYAGAAANGLTIGVDQRTVQELRITDFGNDGILVQSNNNTIRGNSIGMASFGNGGPGIEIAGTAGNTIGGPEARDGNTIEVNQGDGVYIWGKGATGNVIASNRIEENKGNGVTIDEQASNNIIGVGTQKGEDGKEVQVGARNVIGHNWKNGVFIDGASNTNQVGGNLIGLFPNMTDQGENAVNRIYGVSLLNSSNNLIGGDGAAFRNIISGNGMGGVRIEGGSGNTLIGNYIGLNLSTDNPDVVDSNSSGTGNLADGVYIIDSNSNHIGVPGKAQNVIAGNGSQAANIGNGVFIRGSKTKPTGNSIENNVIGADPKGASPLPNVGDAIRLENLTDATVRNNRGFYAPGQRPLRQFNVGVVTEAGNVFKVAPKAAAALVPCLPSLATRPT